MQAEGTGQAAKAQGACPGKSFGTWHMLTSGPEWGCVMGPKWRVSRLARRVRPEVLGVGERSGGLQVGANSGACPPAALLCV